MKKILLCLGFSIGCALNMAAAEETVASVITAITSDVNTFTTACDTLSGFFDTARASAATTLGTSITDSGDSTTLTNALGNIYGTPTSDQITTLNALQTSLTQLAARCILETQVGQMQNATATALYSLATIDVSQSHATISSTIASNTSALATAQANAATNANNDQTAGYNTTGGASWTHFTTEQTRTGNAHSLSVQLGTAATNWASYQTALAALPSPSDPTIEDYDTALLAAYSSLQSAAQTVVSSWTTALNQANLLANTNASAGSSIDTVGDAATTLAAQINQFITSANAQLASINASRANIALRVYQQQLLFTVNTYAAKQSLLGAIASQISSGSTAATQLQNAVASIGSLLSVPAATFSPTPTAPPSEDEESPMAITIDAQVAAYLVKLDGTLNGLFSPPLSQSNLDQVNTVLSPAIYLKMISATMTQWLTARITDIMAADPLTTEILNGYIREWNQIITTLNTPLGSGYLSNSVIATITGTSFTNALDGLFTGVTTGTPSVFVTNAQALLVQPSGPIAALLSLGIAEFQRLALLVIANAQSGSRTAPPATKLTTTPTIPTVPSLPTSPDTTITTTTLTHTLPSGATVLITGSDGLAGELSEPVFENSVENKLNANLQIFINSNATVGLGTANLSTSPGQVPNVLGGAGGEGSVQIIPDGSGLVTVNADLLIGGSTPIVPTPNFGTAAHTLTFYSSAPRTITITSGTTWDLSGFGLTGDSYVANGKQIVFGGNVSLVLEPGAHIRFPMVDPSLINQSVILRFTDNSSLVFQGDTLSIGNPWTGSSIAGSDCQRCKILGMGQIWFDSNARMIINKPALVGIEADYTTPATDITVNVQGNAQVTIGTTTTAGGALQIGNMYEGGSSFNPDDSEADSNFPNGPANSDYGSSFTPRDTTINFTLTLNSQNALFQIGQQGFFGLAAGVLCKDGAPALFPTGPNGSTSFPHSAWTLQHLYDVQNITLNIVQGTFDHSLICDGTSSKCSMLAVSRLKNAFPYSKYILEIGTLTNALVRGGGTVYFVDTDASLTLHNTSGTISVVASPHTVNILSAANNLSFTVSNSGTYAPLAPSIATASSRATPVPGISAYEVFGRGIVERNSTYAYVFAGPAEEFFYALRLTTYSDTIERFIPLAYFNNSPTIAYIVNGTIVRTTISNNSISDGTVLQAIPSGYIRGARSVNGIPSRFYLPVF